MINRGTFGSRWGGLGDFPPTTTGVETPTDGEEVEDGVDGTDGEVEDGEIDDDFLMGVMETTELKQINNIDITDSNIIEI